MAADDFSDLGELLTGGEVLDWDEDRFGAAAGRSVEREDMVWDSFTQDMMRYSCAFFASEVLQGPPQAPYNGRFLVAAHHSKWDDLVADNDRVCVLAPRDHGKTFFFDFAYPIWKAAFLPGGKGYIFSATQDQAVRILEDIKEEIESNPKLAWLNPTTKSRNWSKTQITLANGHKIYARGFGTKIRGAHPDWIVVDDGLNDEDAYSELVRRKHIDYFYTAITNMCVPGGQIAVVGTPFHGADLYADLAQNPRYCFRKYPALTHPGNEALWPQRYCATERERKQLKDKGIIVESLENKKREIGSVRFTREFLVEPISDDMSLFPERLFRGSPVEVMHAKMGQPASYYAEFGIVSYVIGFDFAISSSASADWTVGFVLGLDEQGNRWVVDIQRHQGLPFNAQKSLINALGRKYDPDLIYLEANQMQRIFGDDLIRETDLPIYKFVTSGNKKTNGKQPGGNTHTMNKNTLEGGVPQLRVVLENGKVRIPRGDKESCEKSDIWIAEMKCFTWLEGKLQGVGSHDDTVMAFWIACCAVRAGSFSATFGPGEQDGKTLEEFLQEEMAEEAENQLSGEPLEALLDAWGADDEPEDMLTDIMEGEAAEKGVPVDDIINEMMGDTRSDAWKGLPGLGGGDAGDFKW